MTTMYDDVEAMHEDLMHAGVASQFILKHDGGKRVYADPDSQFYIFCHAFHVDPPETQDT